MDVPVLPHENEGHGHTVPEVPAAAHEGCQSAGERRTYAARTARTRAKHIRWARELADCTRCGTHDQP